VTGVTACRINADEPRTLDYNDYNQPGLYNPDACRLSDRDPVITGLELRIDTRFWGLSAAKRRQLTRRQSVQKVRNNHNMWSSLAY
jgi:hypothetical protein